MEHGSAFVLAEDANSGMSRPKARLCYRNIFPRSAGVVKVLI